MIRIISLLALITTLPVYAKGKSCEALSDCVEKVSKLTGKKYLFANKLKGFTKSTANFSITKENADNFISRALHQNGYTRIPLKEKNGYQIINSRDTRYTPVPIYIPGKDQLPNNDDYIMVSIKLKEIEPFTIIKSFRPFITRYGRIVEVKHKKGTVILQDTALNVVRFLSLVKKT